MTSAFMFHYFNTRRNRVALFLLLIPAFLAARLLFAQDQEEMRGAPAEPTDAPEIHAQMAIAENLLGKTPDRGAVLYFLAVSHAQLHETRGAMSNLSECVALQEGFDPDGDPAFAAFRSSGDFTKLVQKAHKDFPAIARSRLAYTIQEKDLIPEGLAYDSLGDLFYLGSLYRRNV